MSDAGPGPAEFETAALDMLRRIGGDALVGEMVRLFAEQTTIRLTAAREAIAATDALALRRAFHSLKSSAAQLGAAQAARLAAAGETGAGQGDTTTLAPTLSALEASLERALEWLRANQTTVA